ncbi:unnamed protein product [Somion occarium]|uniref:Uncharacterized protein n=1 Tax=Somion occarium TaxID=3059160 RepID=A0ABP1CRQ0_9APHY
MLHRQLPPMQLCKRSVRSCPISSPFAIHHDANCQSSRTSGLLPPSPMRTQIFVNFGILSALKHLRMFQALTGTQTRTFKQNSVMIGVRCGRHRILYETPGILLPKTSRKQTQGLESTAKLRAPSQRPS